MSDKDTMDQEQNDIAIRVSNLSKCYQIYDTPRDRLKQFILPRIQHAVGRQPAQYFREFWALKDVSFEVRKGETIGIIGRNGSGKSTLLQMICGTLNPTAGSITTHGRIAALLELGSGFNPEFTGRENVYMNASVLGLSKEEIDQRFDDIAAFADIGEFIEQPVKTYSSGMMVRLAFSVAINVDPEILIVDEALSVGDEAFQRKCFARIEEIKRVGGTILFVTHATQLVIEMCDQTVLLHHGRLVFGGNSHQAVNLYYRIIGKSNDVFCTELAKEEAPLASVQDIDKKDQPICLESTVTVDDAFSYENTLVNNLPTFDASLVSKTSHETHEEKYGVTISNIKLQNLLSDQINILIQGQRYIVSFDVLFTHRPNNINYQVLFKTINGIPIAGDRFFHEQAFGTSPSAGKKFCIYYEFQSLMNPGVYFISIEACGDEGGQYIVYHKFAEILAFRILTKGRGTAIGYTSVIPVIQMKDF